MHAALFPLSVLSIGFSAPQNNKNIFLAHHYAEKRDYFCSSVHTSSPLLSSYNKPVAVCPIRDFKGGRTEGNGMTLLAAKQRNITETNEKGGGGGKQKTCSFLSSNWRLQEERKKIVLKKHSELYLCVLYFLLV